MRKTIKWTEFLSIPPNHRCERKETSDVVPSARWSDANAAQRRISAMSVGVRYNWPTAGVCAAFHPRIDFTPSLCPSSTPPLCNNNNHQPTNQPTLPYSPILSYPILSYPLAQRNFSLCPTRLPASPFRSSVRRRACTYAPHTRTRSTRARRNKERTRNERAGGTRGSGWGGRGDTQRKVTRFTGNARKPREREGRGKGKGESGDG